MMTRPGPPSDGRLLFTEHEQHGPGQPPYPTPLTGELTAGGAWAYAQDVPPGLLLVGEFCCEEQPPVKLLPPPPPPINNQNDAHEILRML